MVIKINIPKQANLIEWLRFIKSNRNQKKSNFRTRCVFNFTGCDFLYPYHLSSLACLIEEYKKSGAIIEFKVKHKTEAGKFIKYTKFDKYWNDGFDRNFCLKSEINNTLPIWQYQNERIDAFATLAENFYSCHSITDKDMSPLRITVVEALNNISDHSESKVSGFVSTQYYKSKSEIVIGICDFGKGIPKRVNDYFKKTGEKKLSDPKALEAALEKGFSTKSIPSNRGFGLDTILSNVHVADGEIILVSNNALFSKRMKSGVALKKIADSLGFSFPGTYLVIKLNTNKFRDKEEETHEEMKLL